MREFFCFSKYYLVSTCPSKQEKNSSSPLPENLQLVYSVPNGRVFLYGKHVPTHK